MGKTLVRDETIPEAPSVDPAEIDFNPLGHEPEREHFGKLKPIAPFPKAD